jgi:hypothetical protein
MTGRDTRVVAGVAALVIGIALIGSAVLDLGEDSRSSTAAQATPTASPSTSASAPSPVGVSASPPATPSAPLSSSAATAPGPDSTPDPFTRVSAFTSVMIPAMRDADAATLASLLHPATIERYGLDACLEELGRINDPTFDIVVHGVGSPEPWDYTTDGVTTTIPDALDVDAAMTVNGATEATDLHLAIVDGEVRWFTDCGTPRP